MFLFQFNNFSNSELEQRLQESERIKNELEIRMRSIEQSTPGFF